MPEQNPIDDLEQDVLAPVEPTAGRGRLLRRLLGWGATGLLLIVVFVIVCDLYIGLSSRPWIYDDIDAIPEAPVALVLGTASTHRGRPNLFYVGRIESAAALLEHGRVRGILVSGDNAQVEYNEPRTMRRDLIKAGVPPELITLDFAGFRTLDSVVRAARVFGQQRFIVVSQHFHVARAIFIARAQGIDAIGFAAPGPKPPWGLRVRAREVLARASAVLDVIIGTEPHFLGDLEPVRLLPLPPPPEEAAEEPERPVDHEKESSSPAEETHGG